MHLRSLVSSALVCTFAALGSLSACDGPKSSLGDLPGTTTDPAEATDAIGSEESGEVPASGAVGAPCQLSATTETYALELGNAECGSDMCLYADDVYAGFEQSCTEDGDCPGAGEGVICGPAGECILDPDHVAERSMCTDFCEADADCVGADGTTCAGGFACLPIQSLGPECCQKVCACLDDVNVVAAEGLAIQCEAGTQAGCCDQDPPGAGCGG